MISALLFLAAFRIGPEVIFGAIREIKPTLGIVAVYQLIAPVVAFGLCLMFGAESTTTALAIVLTLAAPPITGSANFAILMGHDPASALRLLLFGTVLFPVSVLPVLLLLPALGVLDVLASALRLSVVVFISVCLAFVLRNRLVPDITARGLQALDGMSAILLGVMVVGLMSAIGPLLSSAPLSFFRWLAIAFLLNFGMQLLSWVTVARTVPPDQRAGVGIVAGNRNVALFLVALPASLSDTLLAFIGCYQIPMYLTPLLMGWLYRRPRSRLG